MNTFAKICLLALLLNANAFGQGTILWDESVNGPFSQFSSTPTSLSPFQFGINSVLGSVEIEPTGNNWLVHEDFFTVQVPVGFQINAVYLTIDGPQVGLWIGNPTFSTELAFVQNPTSGELLPQWGIGSIPFGTYGLDIANHDAQAFTTVASYRLDFFVQAVPEPSPLALALTGLAICVGFRFRRNSWKKAC
ncbi:MAG: hypothetical protein MUF81_05225 [Verrucomicrobia bacterium]|jgi:hypothetical protein|nr:hypothetical protein [Verrucomicrobiota bacterium]